MQFFLVSFLFLLPSADASVKPVGPHGSLTEHYHDWRARHGLTPIKKMRDEVTGAHSMSLCQAKEAEKERDEKMVANAHDEKKAVPSFLQRSAAHSFLQRSADHAWEKSLKKSLAHQAPGEERKGGKLTEASSPSLPYDGYFEFGCMIDASPAGSRLDYKAEIKRKFGEAEPVDAKVCFEFCRDRPQYKFFGLSLGRDCYCAEYIQRAPGSSEQCDRQCEGNGAQMCGGDTKQTTYEMHRCSDTISQAEETIREVAQFREYGEGLIKNGTLLLKGMDATAEAVDVTAVRQQIFNNSRSLNKMIRDIDDINEKCSEHQAVALKLIPDTDPANVTDLQALEKVQRELAALCGDKPGRPQDGTKFQVAVFKLFTFMDSHDVNGALAKAGVNMDSLMVDPKGAPPNSMNRMTDAMIEAIGCDDTPADGCDGFNLIYWPQADSMDWFTDFYTPADHNPPMPAEEWVTGFTWLCKDLCDHTDKCVAADVYGTAEEGMDLYTMNCDLKDHVEHLFLSAGNVENNGGYGYDRGMMVEAYFQLVKDELEFTID